MNLLRNKLLVCCFFAFVLSVFTFEFYGKKSPKPQTGKVVKVEKMTDSKKFVRTEAEWKETLTEKQFHILRKAGTERPFGEEYEEFKKQGTGKYHCAGCNTELFTSDTKFDSKCGWPSFFDPANAKNVNTFDDFHLGYKRTEVRCAVCDGHLGHVFLEKVSTRRLTRGIA